MIKYIFIFCFLISLQVHCQVQGPEVYYKVSIDTINFSGFSVEMKILNSPKTLLLAFARHPEYDEKFWKNLKDLKAESNGEVYEKCG